MGSPTTAQPEARERGRKDCRRRGDVAGEGTEGGPFIRIFHCGGGGDERPASENGGCVSAPEQKDVDLADLPRRR